MHMDMQKDTVIRSIASVALNPDHQNVPIFIDGITEVTVNGVPLGVDGYLDIGLIDTMKDLMVNFIGAAVFSAIGYSYIKTCGKGKICKVLHSQAAAGKGERGIMDRRLGRRRIFFIGGLRPLSPCVKSGTAPKVSGVAPLIFGGGLGERQFPQIE